MILVLIGADPKRQLHPDQTRPILQPRTNMPPLRGTGIFCRYKPKARRYHDQPKQSVWPDASTNQPQVRSAAAPRRPARSHSQQEIQRSEKPAAPRRATPRETGLLGRAAILWLGLLAKQSVAWKLNVVFPQ